MKRGDLWVIFSVLLVAAVLACVFFLPDTGGAKTLVVEKDGKRVYADALDKDAVAFDDGHNRVIVAGAKAFMESADCRDHLCEQMGAIDSRGARIVCLPNRVMVYVEAVSGEGPDAESY